MLQQNQLGKAAVKRGGRLYLTDVAGEHQIPDENACCMCCRAQGSQGLVPF